jgi:glycopeptide antibiotics resistance protein
MALLLACGAVALAAACAARYPSSKATPASLRARQNLALLAAVAAVFAITLVPTHGEDRTRLIPLQEIRGGLTPPVDWSLLKLAGNLVLFVPLGAALRFRRLSLAKTAMGAALFSATVEVTQTLVSGRTTSIDDAILNTLGAILGYSLASARSSSSS